MKECEKYDNMRNVHPDNFYSKIGIYYIDIILIEKKMILLYMEGYRKYTYTYFII